MLTRHRMGWQGLVTVAHMTAAGQLLHVARMRNLITEGGLDLLVGALAGGDAEIKYLAWGLDGTAPTSGDVALADEAGRKAVTQQQAMGGGAMFTVNYLAPYEANVAIEELGWFGGATATSTPGSGTLLARVLYSYEKNELESLVVYRADILQEGGPA